MPTPSPPHKRGRRSPRSSARRSPAGPTPPTTLGRGPPSMPATTTDRVGPSGEVVRGAVKKAGEFPPSPHVCGVGDQDHVPPADWLLLPSLPASAVQRASHSSPPFQPTAHLAGRRTRAWTGAQTVRPDPVLLRLPGKVSAKCASCPLAVPRGERPFLNPPSWSFRDERPLPAHSQVFFPHPRIQPSPGNPHRSAGRLGGLYCWRTRGFRPASAVASASVAWPS